VRAFDCPKCKRLVFFESVRCLNCGTAIGVAPEKLDVVAVKSPGRRCANHELAGCNWVTRRPGTLCLSCQLTRTRPNDADLAGDPAVAAEFAGAEAAKRRLVWQLLELHLPIVSHHDQPEGGLAFDLLSSKVQPVTTGHANGVITVDLAESNDAHREQMRAELGEAYRTMLGHLRHEVGHYYWTILVQPDEAALTAFRERFGDEQADYASALERHYHDGPPPDWQQEHVSPYATAHPWEDWAESFAHYLHIRDTLQTAAAFGMIVTGPHLDPSLMAAPNIHPDATFEEILADWVPLTLALNAINRSMGKDDLYPFVLSPVADQKLAFVHDRVVSWLAAQAARPRRRRAAATGGGRQRAAS
jgi:hypothetical protein